MPNVLHVSVWSKALIKRSPVCQTVALRKVRGPSLAEVSTRIHWTRFQMVFRGTRVRCTESIWKSWTKSTALVGTFSTSLEELMHAVLAERASLIWESLWCLCLPLIRGSRERQIICQKCPIDLFRNSLSLWQATPFLVGWRKLLAAALSGHSQPADHHLNNNWGEPTYCLKDPVSLVRDWGEDSWPAGTVTAPTWAENT